MLLFSLPPPPLDSFRFPPPQAFEGQMAWDSNPLYALLHESIYCQGGGTASNWAAHRVRRKCNG